MFAIDANTDHAVVMPAMIQAPRRPPGTRYGRWTWPCEYRSLISAGKIRAYDTTVVSVAIESTTANAFEPASFVASTKNSVEIRPDRMFTFTGVPKRAENVPSTRGPQPSMQPIASARSAPMIHVVPLDTIVHTNIAPIA